MDRSRKKILITGSNGLLGQKLIYNLLQRGNFDIIATSKGENRLIRRDGYIYEPLDITSRDEVFALFHKYLPDVVINTAAMTNVDACETKREECLALNVTAVQHLVDACWDIAEKDPIVNTHLIHLSTDFIFDGTAGPYKEDDQPNPLSYYAATKLESEKIVRESKLKWAIVRTIIVYGIVDHMSRSNIVLWAKDALAKGQTINVVDDQFRSPTLAEDLAEGCLLAAEKGATGIFHVSGKDTMSILELVHRVADFWKLDKSLVKPSKSDSLNQPAKRPPRTGFIIDKAIRELGYAPHSFEEGLAVLNNQLRKGDS
ncbi:MAG: dTDP-4-dehydrorhamnose reductase [Bacteroidetes bacterium]|nr:MAG: dTDP-4-dehydrorhamnose reductase [Bacteroidota bacterium]